MCGICGYIDEAERPNTGRALLQRMCEAMVHRGPDDAGIHLDPPAGLGMQRLSIIDIAGGHQPMATEDQRYWIVFNGEVYNFRETRELLGTHGRRFRTASDTEVVLQSFAEWGPVCLERLNGMFAFAIWDSVTKQLFIARDRMGEKPLYYRYADSSLAFASEIKCLLEIPNLERRIDGTALELYLTLGYVPGPLTLFEGIHKLPAGTFMVTDPGQAPRIQRYWDPADAAANGEELSSDHVEELRHLLREACRMRMVADVPVGVLLSGGIDSSAIAANVADLRDCSNSLKTFSVRFQESDLDESSAAKQVAKHLGTEHHELVASACTPETFERMVWHADEPIADPALIPTALVCVHARRHVKVVLTGEGADELFAGYGYYRLASDAARFDILPSGLRRALMVPAATTVNRVIGRPRYHPRTLWAWSMRSAGRSLAWQAIFTDDDKRRYFGAGNGRSSVPGPAEKLFEATGRAGHGGWLERSLYVDMKISLADCLLMKVDKMSMAASLEARAPFLDHRIVELAGRLPATAKLDGHDTDKVILRKALEGLLPPQVTSRRKHGFDTPVRRWLVEDLGQKFQDIVSLPDFCHLGIVDAESVQSLWSEVVEGTPGSARQAWSLLCLAEWQRAFRVGGIA